jgi:UDP-N-acetyl-D-mannosaminuronate dehydrogenase
MISSVIGLGKLGLPFALFLASKNQHVICYDINDKIINKLQNNKSPYIEPKTSEYLKKFKKKLIITKDLSHLIKKSDISHFVLTNPKFKK